MRILLIEDNPGDVRLIKEMLMEAKVAISNLECCSRLSEGLNRFAEGGIDLILLDLGLPDSQGLNTFKKAYAVAQKIPILVLTSNNDESLAKKAVRYGAQDYLIKGKIDSSLLIRSIRYGIERKKAENTLKESEQKYRELVECTNSIIMKWDTKGKIILINEFGEKYFGYDHDDLLGKSMFETILPSKETFVWDPRLIVEEILSSSQLPYSRLDENVKKNGERVWVYWTNRPLLNEKGKPTAILSVGADMTSYWHLEDALHTSEEKYRLLIENQTEFITKFNPDTRLTFVNDAYAKVFGEPVSDLIGTKWIENVLEEDREKVKGQLRELRPDHDTTKNTNREIKADGSVMWTEWVNKGIFDRDGNLRDIYSVGRDITERKKAEKEIQSMAKFPNENPFPVFRVDKKGLLLFANPAGQELLVPSKSRVGDPVPGLLRKTVFEAMESKRQLEVEREVNERLFSLIVTPVASEDYVNIYGSDITKRKKAEGTLRESEEKYRELVENANSIILKWDTKGIVSYYNEYAESFFGFKREEVIGKSAYETFVPKTESSGRDLSNLVNDISNKKEYENNVNENVKKNGERVWISWTNKPIKDKNGKLVGSLSIGIDTTKRRILEEELKTTKQQLQDMIEFLPDATMAIDTEGCVIAWSQSMETLTGRTKEEMLGKGDYAYAVPLYATKRPMLLNMILNKDEQILEKYVNIKRTGMTIEAESNYGKRWLWSKASAFRNEKGELTGAIETIRDVTAQKNMEEELLKYTKMLVQMVEEKTLQLQNAQRLVTIGETATMVGHDLRNPLQSIINTMYILNKRVIEEMPSSPTKKVMTISYERIERNVNYMNKIVSDLLDYARPMVPEFSAISLQRLINAVLADIKVPDNVAITLLFNRDLAVMVDSQLIKRAFTNLITNAIQSMPDGGALTITAEDTVEGTFIKFIDTGQGIPDDMMKNLFTPFATTKAKGMGMGLVVVKRIIDAHKGNVDVKSEVGKGTTFAITIPIKQPS